MSTLYDSAPDQAHNFGTFKQNTDYLTRTFTPYGDFLQESFQSFSTEDSGNPPADIAADAATLLARPWSDLAGDAYIQRAIFKFRGRNGGSIINPPPGLFPTNFQEVRFGGATRLDTEGTFTPTFPGPNPGGSPSPNPGPFIDIFQDINWQKRYNGPQGSGWYFFPEGIAGFHPGFCQPWLSRCRHQYPIDAYAFVVGFEIWANWIDFPNRNFDWTYSCYPTLVSDNGIIAGGTWFEPAYPDTAPGGSSNGSFSDGFVGRFNMTVRNETPTQWAIRTGVPIVPIPPFGVGGEQIGGVGGETITPVGG